MSVEGDLIVSGGMHPTLPASSSGSSPSVVAASGPLPLPIQMVEPLSMVDKVLKQLEDRGIGNVSTRLRELLGDEVDSSLLETESAVNFASTLMRAKWPAPTHIGLTDAGAISASWRNEALVDAMGSVAYTGSVVMVFPQAGNLYEITAMYGQPADNNEWVQVVGNLEKKKAIGLLDQIIDGFHS